MKLERRLQQVRDGADRYEVYRELVAEGGVHRSLLGFVLLTAPADVLDALRTPHFGTEPGAARFGRRVVDGAQPEARVARMQRLAVAFLDPPSHPPMRRMLAGAFTPGAVSSAREAIAREATDLVSRLPRGVPVDLATAFASPLAASTLAIAIGLHPQMTDRLARWGAQIGGVIDVMHGRQAIEAGERALAEIDSWLREEERTHASLSPKGLVHALLSEAEAGTISRDQLVANIGFLLGAGQETTRNAIASTLAALAADAEALPLLRSRRELVDAFVEETLRLEAPLQFTMRTAVADHDLPSGSGVRRGERVLVGLASANRERERYRSGDHPPPHTSFGGGAHYCLGASLARAELNIAVDVVLDGVDSLRLASPIKWLPSVIFRGPASVDVVIDR